VDEAQIGFIGGSGLYRMEGLSDAEERQVDTPFGSPSDAVVLGTFEGRRVAFLPRHGRGHRFSPTRIPARANIYALKSLGVERIVSVSAVGSLQEDIHPLEIVVPDQIIDRTRSRVNTFFDDGIVAHVGFADPFCGDLSSALVSAARGGQANTHVGGTYVVMEGPQFSTRAESELYRSWGASIVGMTAIPEAKLAREAEICYTTMAMVTDYDCWHESEEEVSVEMIVANLNKNAAVSASVLRALVRTLGPERNCGCGSSLENAIITGREHIGEETRTRLAVIIGKYV
jgi:5'-methylthioadenosine phosphorylase